MEQPRLTDKAARELDERFALQNEAVHLLGAVVAEWQSDPPSVQCFDRLIVERAKYVVARLKQLAPF